MQDITPKPLLPEGMLRIEGPNGEWLYRMDGPTVGFQVLLGADAPPEYHHAAIRTLKERRAAYYASV